jgi:hypothetical protein
VRRLHEPGKMQDDEPTKESASNNSAEDTEYPQDQNGKAADIEK